MSLYLTLGVKHILNVAALDHVLFLIALCAVYRIEQWRRVLILVTAFTVGHSLTLALVALDQIQVPTQIVEFLIPMTIVVVAFSNVISAPATTGAMGRHYAMALIFGLVHGMGFSNYFRALLMGEGSVILPLLGFNLGIEIGQILIVGLIILTAFVCLNLIGIKQREWTLFVSGCAFGAGLLLMGQTWPG